MNPEYCQINGRTIEGLSCTGGRYYATHSRQLTGKIVWFGSKPDEALKRFLDWKASHPTEPVKLTDYERLMLEQQYWRDLQVKVKSDPYAWQQFCGVVQLVCRDDPSRSADVMQALAPKPRLNLEVEDLLGEITLEDCEQPNPKPPTTITYEMLPEKTKRAIDAMGRMLGNR